MKIFLTHYNTLFAYSLFVTTSIKMECKGEIYVFLYLSNNTSWTYQKNIELSPSETTNKFSISSDRKKPPVFIYYS